MSIGKCDAGQGSAAAVRGSGVMRTTCREETAGRSAVGDLHSQRVSLPIPSLPLCPWSGLLLARVNMDPGALQEHRDLEMAQSGLETT